MQRILQAWSAGVVNRQRLGKVDVLDPAKLPADLTTHRDLPVVAELLEDPRRQKLAPAARVERHPGGHDTGLDDRPRADMLRSLGFWLPLLLCVFPVGWLATSTQLVLPLVLTVLIVVGGFGLGIRLDTRARRAAVTRRFGYSTDVFTDALVTVDLPALHAQRKPENKTFRDAMATAADIQALPVWNSPELEEHRIRLDLDNALRRIVVRTHEITTVRSELGPAPRRRDRTPQLRSLHQQNAQSLDDAAKAIRPEVEALQRYRADLVQLQSKMNTLESLERLEITSGVIDRLQTETGSHQIGAAHIDDIAADTRPTTEAIGELIDRIRQDLARFRQLR